MPRKQRRADDVKESVAWHKYYDAVPAVDVVELLRASFGFNGKTALVDAPMMSTVRFKINSADISDEEMVNVYNTAEYLKANPSVCLINSCG